jgi:hypothetical protein
VKQKLHGLDALAQLVCDFLTRETIKQDESDRALRHGHSLQQHRHMFCLLDSLELDYEAWLRQGGLLRKTSRPFSDATLRVISTDTMQRSHDR